MSLNFRMDKPITNSILLFRTERKILYAMITKYKVLPLVEMTQLLDFHIANKIFAPPIRLYPHEHIDHK